MSNLLVCTPYSARRGPVAYPVVIFCKLETDYPYLEPCILRSGMDSLSPPDTGDQHGVKRPTNLNQGGNTRDLDF